MGLPVCIRVARELKLCPKWLKCSTLAGGNGVKTALWKGWKEVRGSDNNLVLWMAIKLEAEGGHFYVGGKIVGGHFLSGKMCFCRGLVMGSMAQGPKANKSEKHRKSHYICFYMFCSFGRLVVGTNVCVVVALEAEERDKISAWRNRDVKVSMTISIIMYIMFSFSPIQFPF